MKSFLIAILLLQTAPQNIGVVTGVVRGANGMPSAGVRVYAMAVRDTIETASFASALESLSETDGSGRYRLEIAPGRYYIASGSVSAPTFYPGTLDAAMARVVTVSAGAIVEAIDFSSFVPATRMPTMGGLPVGTAVLSGVIRFPDGSPAAGIFVTAVPASQFAGGLAPAGVAAPGGSIILLSRSAAPGAVPPTGVVVSPSNFAYVIAGPRAQLTMTDVTGGYVFSNLPTDTFYIAAGFAEAPTLFPGVSDTLAARSIATTPTTNLNSLDFTMPRPPAGVTVTGRATVIAGVPADGTMIEIRSASGLPSAYGLPTLNPMRTVSARADGSFEITGVSPGSYTLNASFSGVRAETRNIVVADQPLSGLDFSFRLASLSGRISAEDGSAFADARAFIDAIVTTVDNPNILASTILPISSDGTFSRILEPGNYRFYLRTLPEEYSIKSMTAGGVDLLRETLRFNGEPMTVDVRVTKRAASSDPAAVGVKGRALDSVTGTPSPAERVTLCCRASGPVRTILRASRSRWLLRVRCHSSWTLRGRLGAKGRTAKSFHCCRRYRCRKSGRYRDLKSYRLPNLVNWQRRLSMRMATLFRWIPLRRLCSQGAVDGHGWSPVAAETGLI